MNPGRGTELVLHVGMPYAGGDVLRRSLVALREQLRAHGVGYVDHTEVVRLPGLAGWVAEIEHDPSLAGRFAAEFGALIDAARVAVGGTVVVSTERLLGARPVGAADAERFRPQAEASIAQVLAAVPGSHARIVLYPRRQDRLLEHAHIRRVMAGDGGAFATHFPFRYEPVLDYAALLERIEAVPGVTGVVVKPYELLPRAPGGFVDDFLDVLGLRGRLDLTPVAGIEPGRIYSAEGVRVARVLLDYLETPEERRRWRSFAVNTFGAANDDDTQTMLLSGDARNRILRAYTQANRRLFCVYLPGLSPRGYDAPPRTAGQWVRAAAGRVVRPLRRLRR